MYAFALPMETDQARYVLKENLKKHPQHYRLCLE